MKTVTAIFLVFASALLVPGAYSQPDEVYLSLSKSALKDLPVPADAENIEIPDFQRGASASAADLLNTDLPALLINTGDGGLTTAGLRGFSTKQTAIMFDGMRVPANLTGTVDLSALPAGGIERVEVLPGAWSAVQGADAEGGVINFISRTPAPGVTRADLSSSLSSYGGNSAAVSFANSRAFAKTSLTASRDASNGFQQNSAWQKEFYNAKTELAVGDGGKLSIDLLRNNSENGVPGGTPVPIGDWNGSKEKEANSLVDSQHSALGLAGVTYEMPLNKDVSCSLSGEYGVNRLLAHMPEYGPDELERTLNNTARLSFSFFNKGEAGVEYEKSLLKSDTYGDHFTQNTGLFAQWALQPLKGLSVIPSFRYDRNIAYDDQASPKLAVVYAPDYVWKFSAQTGRAWQAPTFADLYDPWVPPADRSPDLKPEYSWQTQAAAEGNFASGIWTKLSAYYANVKDRIALDPITWAAYNLDSAFNEGVEAGLGYKASSFSAGLGYAYNLSKGCDGGPYQRLNFSPLYRFSLDAALKTPWADINTKAYYTAPQYTGLGETGVRLPAYLTENLYFSRKFDRFEVFAGADNIFNAHYAQTADAASFFTPALYFPQPGRVFKGGISVRFI
jgi:outer membrane receptor protein involved in Fe transport